jgi:mono/diheme cytochrome c family protein
MKRRAALCCATVALLFLLCGCEKIARNMYDQPRVDPQQPTSLFDDGSPARREPPGTVPRTTGIIAGTSSGRTGAELEKRSQGLDLAPSQPLPLSPALLQRGRERFDIFCAPCHSAVGDGDGMIVRRGFPAPPSFHTDRLRAAPDRHVYEVMSAGYGVMPSYADRISPEDRWKIVSYIRALQFSQSASIGDVPADQAAALARERN